MNVKFCGVPRVWVVFERPEGGMQLQRGGRGVGVPLCPAVGGNLSLSLSLSDRLSFSPAHSQAVQPAAITTPQPLCHSNAMQ